METTKKRPVHKIKYGAIAINIWENDDENGPWYSATLTRTYRVKGTNEFKNSTSLSGNELLVAAEALSVAYHRIQLLRQKSEVASK